MDFFCRWVADVPPRETSPAAKSEEKRMFSQARKIPANLGYHTSIKKSQAIPKCFIDLKYSVWFTLGSEGETMFCDT